MVAITEHVVLDDDELSFSFIRASGPGGQNVNKVSTAVELRFDLRNSPSLPEGLKRRAERLGSRWLTLDGHLVLVAQSFRTQELNRRDAIERLVELLRESSAVPKPRRPTRPTLGSKKRRLEKKAQRGRTKSLRGRVTGSE